jgi:hypothetical protein
MPKSMTRWSGRHETCPICGIVYETFKTGMNFGDVRMMLWTGDPNCDQWKYKRRHTVLGLWHQIKKSMWYEHVHQCEQQYDWVMEQKHKDDARDVTEIEELLLHMPAETPSAWTTDVPAEGYLGEAPF